MDHLTINLETGETFLNGDLVEATNPMLDDFAGRVRIIGSPVNLPGQLLEDLLSGAVDRHLREMQS